MDLVMFLQHLINGISLGGIYALIAIGYTLVFGILRLINFAHGDIFMIGAYIAFYGTAIFYLPWYVSFLFAVLLTALLGIGVERIAYRPLRKVARIYNLISAIGVSMLLENIAIVIFGGRPKAFPSPSIFTQVWSWGKIQVPSLTIFTIITTLIFLIIVTYIIYNTKTGRAMRALAVDFETAMLMGVNINKVISFTFALGSALAGVGAIMWSLKFPQLVPLMGVWPGLKCFIAAVIGGIGSLPGAVLGGFLLGLLEILIVAFFKEMAGLKYAIAYSALIIILFIKPTGILGKTYEQKA
ncbi:MAG: branched-chain amino acid ABC transporter permease [Conexivisphaerales archaeon]